MSLRSRLGFVTRLRFRDVFFLGNFAAAKLTVYIMPVALATLASERLYSAIELALAAGLQGCAILLGSSLAGITQVYLIRGQRQVADLILLLTFASTLLLTLLILVCWVAGTSMFLVLGVAILSTTVIQNTGSTWYRMRGERNRTAWIDGASLLLVGAVALAAVGVAGPDGAAAAAAILAAITALAAIASGALLAFRRQPRLYERLRDATLVGLPMMIVGIFAIWLGVGGRLLIGIINPAEVAAYAVAFRISALAFGVHQLAATAAFPTLYATRTRAADRVLSWFLLAVLAVSLLLSLAGPAIVYVHHFSALDARGEASFQALVPVTSLHTFFWIAFSLLQFRINRSGAAKRSILPILAVTLAGTGVILLAARFVSHDVRFISALLALHAGAYFGVAWLLLARRKLPHWRVGAVALIATLLLGGAAAVAVLR